MATTEEVREIVIKPMARMFGKPFGCRSDEELAATKADYVASLRPFPVDTLQAAWADVRAKWTKTTWPPIGVLVDAATRARRELATTSGGIVADRSRRFAAAIEYMADGTAPPPGLNLPLKQLIAARVSELTKRGLALGKRETVPYADAEAIARRILSEAA